MGGCRSRADPTQLADGLAGAARIGAARDDYHRKHTGLCSPLQKQEVSAMVVDDCFGEVGFECAELRKLNTLRPLERIAGKAIPPLRRDPTRRLQKPCLHGFTP